MKQIFLLLSFFFIATDVFNYRVLNRRQVIYDLMPGQAIFVLMLGLIFSCKSQTGIIPVREAIKLGTRCENERYLLEDTNSNLEYSFDTIFSAKSYWEHVTQARAKSAGRKLYPFITLQLDSPSYHQAIRLCLVGDEEWENDSRLKTAVDNDRMDSIWLTGFYDRVSREADTLQTRKAEVFLSFYRDSIADIKGDLKRMARIYLGFQHGNSKRLFNQDLCSLSKGRLDSLKKNVPFRIRLMRH
jgi:hypothetical protein